MFASHRRSFTYEYINIDEKKFDKKKLYESSSKRIFYLKVISSHTTINWKLFAIVEEKNFRI